MKLKLLIATLLSVVVATTAHANTDYATVVRVEANYQNVSVPTSRQECDIVDVPIYSGKSQSSTGDVIVGAVIGGAIGNQFGGGSGKDAATVLGAIIGADIANKKTNQEQIVGYRQEKRCNKVVYYETEEQIKNYTVWYDWNGIVNKTVTISKYRVGEVIPVRISIQVK
jgi:uncharacterized protein YcfJ